MTKNTKLLQRLADHGWDEKEKGVKKDLNDSGDIAVAVIQNPKNEVTSEREKTLPISK